MKNEFDEKQDLSLPSVSFQNHGLELSPRQAEIYRNLEAIGPEIAAFYLSGVKVLQNDDLETSSYLLAHIAREIEGGLRDIFSADQEKRKIQKQLKKADLGNLNERIGHIASILAALGIDNLNVPLAQRWISVATRFHEFAHRHGAWKSPRSKEEFIPLWREFEDVLTELVGTHFNLLNRLDRILAYEPPTKEMIRTLPNLLASKVRYNYFFDKLDSLAWLKPLKDEGWFHPDSQPTSWEMPDQPVYFWYALKYVEKVVNHTKEFPCEETFSVLADITNTIVNYANNSGENVTSSHTDCQVIKIICALPIERIESRHITFIGISLRSRGTTLVDSVIGETVLPKFLNDGSEELILALLKVILDAKVVNRRVIPVVEEYWLRAALKAHGEAIAELCGIEAAQIVLAQIQNLVDQDAYAFDFIQQVKGDASDDSREDYAELLVSFTSTLFQFTEPGVIAGIVKTLLQESQTIFRRIAVTAVTHHYEKLKQLFWRWKGNPLEDVSLKPELYQLIETNCAKFKESEIDQILHWIESAQYKVSTEDAVAYRKREWLSALLETANQKTISASRKYEQINAREIKHPGLSWSIETWWGDPSPVTVEDLSSRSNAQIASFLTGFKEQEVSGPLVPTEEGLRETLEKCVATNPGRFADDLQPFFNAKFQYQYSLFQGFLNAWRDEKKFDWAKLLNFIDQSLSSEQFWSAQRGERFHYRDWILSAIADLVEAGTKDDTHAFDAQLLPLAEKILLVLVEKVESETPVIVTRGDSSTIDLPATFLNTGKSKVFSAMVNYALRFARINDIKQSSRWPRVVREDFTKRLDRNVEPSIGFSFTLGAYLPNLLYLDEEWVVNNINRIFPKEDEYHWQVVFSGYLFYSRKTYATLYSLLKKHGHYQKALNTDFGDPEVDRWGLESLIYDLYVGWIENWETLDDETSLIYHLVNSGKPNLLSTLIHSFWKQRDNLTPKMRAKVKSTWRALYESLSQKSDIMEYQEVLSQLSGWVALVDRIDAEVLKWLKMSMQYVKGLTDSAFFVEDLLKHVRKTPKEVADIYLGMLTHNIYPYHDQEHIREIVRVLYNTKHKEVADRICNLYGEAGFDFLRSLYDENHN